MIELAVFSVTHWSERLAQTNTNLNPFRHSPSPSY